MSAVAALLLSLTGTDRLGDPTPPGVTARYGSPRLCVGTERVFRVVFHPTRDEVYATAAAHDGYNDGVPPRTRGWDAAAGTQVFLGERGFQKLTFDPPGRLRMEARPGGTVRVWDTVTNREAGRASFGRRGDVEPVGVHGDRLSAAEWRGPMQGGKCRVMVRRIADGRTGGPDIPVNLGDDVRSTATGDAILVLDHTAAEVRAYDPPSGRLRGWRTFPADGDYDPSPRYTLTPGGRRRIVTQVRADEKADRYRGHPECAVRVYDAAGRLEAHHAFRLDDDGSAPGKEFYVPVVVSQDGHFAAWSDRRDRLLVRHLPTGRLVTAQGADYHIYDVAFNATGTRLGLIDRDGVVRLIDPHTGRFQHAADNPATAAKQTAISPDGTLVATGHACGEVWVWDAATGKPLWHTEPDGSEVRELHFNPAGTTVSAVGFWGPIGVRTWNAKTGQELGPMLPYRYFRTISVSADGKRIADLIEEKGVMEKGQWAYPLFVRTREVATGKEVGRVRLDHRLGLGNETNAVVSRDGRVMVVTHNADGGETIAYDTSTGKRIAKFDRHPANGNSDWAVSADGQIVAQLAPVYTNANRPMRIFDLTAVNPDRPAREHEVSQDTPQPVLSSDGRYAALNGPNGCVVDLRRGGGPLRVYSHPVAAFFPDGESVLTLPGIRGAERVSLEPLAWKVAPRAKPTESRLKRYWTQLGEPAALDAVFELARHSAEAVPFLKSKLLTERPDATAVAAHVERLGSKLFAERDEASKALRELGPETLPALRAALKAGPPPEVRSRLEKLIAVHADTAAPFTLTRLRAVEVLERCDTPGGRAVLETVANTRPGTPWADDAARALMRSKR